MRVESGKREAMADRDGGATVRPFPSWCVPAGFAVMYGLFFAPVLLQERILAPGDGLVLSTPARKFGDEFQAASHRSSGRSLARSLRRSSRVNFHSKGLATLS